MCLNQTEIGALDVGNYRLPLVPQLLRRDLLNQLPQIDVLIDAELLQQRLGDRRVQKPRHPLGGLELGILGRDRSGGRKISEGALDKTELDRSQELVRLGPE